MFHAVLVTLKESGQTGTIIHDKGATLGALCGNAAVRQGQDKLKNGDTAAELWKAATTHPVPCALVLWAPKLT